MPDSNQARHNGSCFCGAVEVETTGEPFSMGYCHCSDCRAWAATPVNGFTLWKLAAVKVKRGEEFLATYRKTARSHRQYCTKCGGHVMTAHPSEDFIDVYAAILPTLTFKPQMHVHYGETVLRIKDGLPKFKHLPKEFGGSGEEVSE
jgi:hypothetical protein